MGRPTGAHVSGPLQPFARGFLIELIELGYEFTAQFARLRLMAELSSWMAARGVEPAGLTASLVSEFVESARSRAWEGLVLADVGAAAGGVLAWAGLGFTAGGAGRD